MSDQSLEHRIRSIEIKIDSIQKNLQILFDGNKSHFDTALKNTKSQSEIYNFLSNNEEQTKILIKHLQDRDEKLQQMKNTIETIIDYILKDNPSAAPKLRVVK